MMPEVVCPSVCCAVVGHDMVSVVQLWVMTLICCAVVGHDIDLLARYRARLLVLESR